MSTEEPEQGSTPRMDPSIERGMFLPRLSRRDLLKYAGMGAGAIGLSALLEACGVKGASVSQNNTGPTATPSSGPGSATSAAPSRRSRRASPAPSNTSASRMFAAPTKSATKAVRGRS